MRTLGNRNVLLISVLITGAVVAAAVITILSSGNTNTPDLNRGSLLEDPLDIVTSSPRNTNTSDLNRDLLLEERLGFSADVQGGYDGVSYVVTSLDDNGQGTLRDALESSEPQWITFAIDGTIELASPIRVQSYKTIDGRGAKITIVDYGLAIYDATDVIVTNITIRDGAPDTKDAIEVLRSDQVWIHHVTLANFPDGLVDIRRADPTTYITVSNSRFQNHDKVSIVGLHEPEAPGDDQIYATFANNYFAGNTVQRHPRVAQAYAHLYNNVIEWSNYGVASFDRGRVFSERNWYVAPDTNKKTATRLVHGGYAGNYLIPDGYLKSQDDRVENGAIITTAQANLVDTPGYEYSPKSTSLRNKEFIMNNAGAR